MNRKQLDALLEEQGLPAVQKGYNYTAFRVRVASGEVDNTVALLRKKKRHVEREYKKAMKERLGPTFDPALKLLPYVCIPRKNSVLVPLPAGTALNVVSEIMSRLEGMPDGARFPVWS